jgi:hypothetical protein
MPRIVHIAAADLPNPLFMSSTCSVKSALTRDEATLRGSNLVNRLTRPTRSGWPLNQSRA